MIMKAALAVLAASIISVSASASAASNTVPKSKNGDGNDSVSGYVVSGLHYSLNATNPGNVDQVSFTLDSAPVAGSTIRAKLSSTGSTWYSCTASGTAVTCATTSPQAVASGIDDVRVVVAD